MFMAAARALADASPARRDKSANLLPPIPELRSVARIVATAVARQAIADGVATRVSERTLSRRIDATIWEPAYQTYRRVRRRNLLGFARR
jgi:malate dehydrogenase (oxaloacetate-decarboxylating)